MARMEVSDGIMTITMDRPKQRNAFNIAMYTDLTAALTAAAADVGVLAVILTGAGPLFSSGADVSGETAPPDRAAVAPVGIFMQCMLAFPKPIIAAVNGPAIGIGTTLLPHCDIVYCSPAATFWTPFTRICVVPEFCSSLLFPAIMGHSVANEMLLMGAQIFPANMLMSETRARVKAMLAFPLIEKSLPLFKRMIRGPRIEALRKVCLEELELLDKRNADGDIAEAVIALFAAKGAKL